MRLFTIQREALKVVQDLSKDTKRFRQVMMKVLVLIEDPNQPDTRALLGHEDMFRVDVGEYRIVYGFDDDSLWIDAIGKRNDDEVYRRL